MTILGVALCTKSLSVILSRSYSEVDVSVINSYVMNASRKNETTFDNYGDTRVIFNSIGSLVICTVCNSLSNPIRDLAIINLISQHLTSKRYFQNEEYNIDVVFDALISIDEMLGVDFVNCANYESLQTYLAMESKEEELQEALNKEAKEFAKLKAKQLSSKISENHSEKVVEDNIYTPVSLPLMEQTTGAGSKKDLEWKLIYVGSAEDENYDQVLDIVLVGPVPIGTNKFIFQAPPPDTKRIPEGDVCGVTVILLVCSYRDQEFVRIGYYVNNEYDTPELNAEPPEKPRIEKLVRNILQDKPRVTKVPILWDSAAEKERAKESEHLSGPDEAMQVDEVTG